MVQPTPFPDPRPGDLSRHAAAELARWQAEQDRQARTQTSGGLLLEESASGYNLSLDTGGLQ